MQRTRYPTLRLQWSGTADPVVVNVKTSVLESGSFGGWRGGKIFPHSEICEQQVWSFSLSHNWSGISEQGYWGRRRQVHPPDLGHCWAGEIQKLTNSILSGNWLLFVDLCDRWRSEFSKYCHVEEGISVLCRREGSRELPICSARQQKRFEWGAESELRRCKVVVWAEWQVAVLWDQCKGCCECGLGLCCCNSKSVIEPKHQPQAPGLLRWFKIKFVT